MSAGTMVGMGAGTEDATVMADATKGETAIKGLHGVVRAALTEVSTLLRQHE
jgi:hypothetical protein